MAIRATAWVLEGVYGNKREDDTDQHKGSQNYAPRLETGA
jgi:hypothetical protein